MYLNYLRTRSRIVSDCRMTRGIIMLIMFFSIALGMIGCSTNPVTGKKELILVSEEWELNVGKQQYSPSRQSQGGDYISDPQVQEYVKQVGQRLAAVSDRKLPYEFNVINSSVPNAWALPGGKIAINRGLLTELQSESELAAVLGHEIVHAAAKHGAKGMQRGMLLQGGVIAATIATQGRQYSNLAQMGVSMGAQLINTKYGRDAERESDMAGITYMSRAGYDPQGAVDLQRTFVKLAEDRRQDFLSGLFSSHPPSAERVQNNIEYLALLPKGGEVGKERYQRKMAHLMETKPAYDAYKEAKKAFAEGDSAKAVRLAEKAISIEPQEGHFHSFLGDIAQKNNRLETAQRHYDRAISLNDNFFYYHLQRGLISEEFNDNIDAKHFLERSLKLLPTSNAYNALGNISRSEREFDNAKRYYAKAAGHKSPAGEEALASLVELDLPSNPGKYIRTRYGLGQNTAVKVQLANTTPRDVTGIVIAIQYPDSQGKLKQIKRKVSGRLLAGKSKVLETEIKIDPRFVSRVKAAVVRARLTD